MGFKYRTDIYTVPAVFDDPLCQKICEQVGGFTLTEARGGYTMDDGTLVIEPSSTLTIVTNGEQTARAVVELVKARAHELGEESILVTGPYTVPSTLVYTT